LDSITPNHDPERLSNEDLLSQYAELLAGFTRKHNLISPNTVPEIKQRHIEHCLMLAAKSFPAGSRVVDWGTGGGLPAIPLAIRFPDVQFTAIDAVEKKILAVRAMVRKLGLVNLDTWHGRAEEWTGWAHFSVSRATAPLETLWSWHHRVAESMQASPPESWRPGLICLKGGRLDEEIATLKASFPSVEVTLTPLAAHYASKFFEEKYIVEMCKI
jgi:16S rRNA (guanine527-N7)-methyltransferase